jgi:5-methylcytosine-specific restriction endonuclease McrA
MYPIKEFKFDELTDSLAISYIKIHNKICKNIQFLKNELQDQSTQNYLDVFLSNYHPLKEEPKLVGNTIICSISKTIRDLNKELKKAVTPPNYALEIFEKTDFYRVLVLNLRKNKQEINNKTPINLNQVILSIFNYESRRKYLLEYYALNKYSVCLYCLAQFTSIYRESDTGYYYLKGNLDHIIPKSSNPYLSISLNNLVPVCGHCNQRKATTSFKYDPFDLEHKH